jgi:hypothetical protein
LGAFVVLVIIFAIRAKVNQDKENTEVSPDSNTSV